MCYWRSLHHYVRRGYWCRRVWLCTRSESKKAIRIYEADPNSFDGINNAETGRTTSIIGIVIGVISVIWYYYMWSSGEYEIIMEEYQHLLDEQ